jgi:hypothetical protein
MRIVPTPVFRWSLLFLAIGFLGRLSAQSIPATTADLPVSFTQVTILPDIVRQGLNGMGIVYQVRFAAPGPEVTVSGTQSPSTLLCRLLDENGLPISVTTGVPRYTCRGACGYALTLGSKDLEAARQGDTLFIPYYAVDMDPGRQRIQATLRLENHADQALLGTGRSDMALITKPATRLVRLELEQIVTTIANAAGETWDYKLFSDKEIYPELQWMLRLGADPLFEGEKQKNDTTYLGNDADRTPWFFISQGDKIQLQVIDFDLLGSSDQIGQTEIDIDRNTYAAGVTYDFSFGQVRNARLKIDAIVPPRVTITDFEVIEDDRELGVSGLRLRMDYTQEQRNRNCEFQLGLAVRTADAEMHLPCPRIVGPGAVRGDSGQVVLTASTSSLNLFIPHYDLRHLDPDARGRIRMDLVTQLDGQRLVVGHVERPLLEGNPKANDLLFGQWKVGAHDREGEGGIRFSIDYEVPEGYFRDAHVGKLSFVPDLDAPWGHVANEDFVALGVEGTDWQDSLLLLKPQNRKGTLDLFLPYHHCGLSAGKAHFAMEYRSALDLEGERVSLGNRGFDMDLELPALLEWEFAVREATVRRRQWLLSDPSLYWVLKIGQTEVFRAPVQASKRSARWPDIHATLVVAETDQIVLQVLHKGEAGEADRLVEEWKTPVKDLPNKPKSSTRVKCPALQRLMVYSHFGGDAGPESNDGKAGRHKQ